MNMHQLIVMGLIISLILLTTCFILWFWFWCTQIRDSLRPDRIVYLSSPVAKIKKPVGAIIEDYRLQELPFLEFGSGIGNTARMLASLSSHTVDAYEVNTLLNITHTLINCAKNITNINIIKGDIFDLKPSQSLIYCFLSTTMLTMLYRKGVFEGNIVIVLKFTIEGVEPSRIIEIGGSHAKLSIFDFRL